VDPNDDVTTVFPAFVRGQKRSNSLVRYFLIFLHLAVSDVAHCVVYFKRSQI